MCQLSKYIFNCKTQIICVTIITCSSVHPYKEIADGLHHHHVSFTQWICLWKIFGHQRIKVRVEKKKHFYTDYTVGLIFEKLGEKSINIFTNYWFLSVQIGFDLWRKEKRCKISCPYCPFHQDLAGLQKRWRGQVAYAGGQSHYIVSIVVKNSLTRTKNISQIQ